MEFVLKANGKRYKTVPCHSAGTQCAANEYGPECAALLGRDGVRCSAWDNRGTEGAPHFGGQCLTRLVRFVEVHSAAP